MGVEWLIYFNLSVIFINVSVFRIFNIQVKDHLRAQQKTQITRTKVFPMYAMMPQKKLNLMSIGYKTNMSVRTKSKFIKENIDLNRKL